MKKVIIAIKAKFITPPTKAKAIRAQQQPRQNNPIDTPMLKDPLFPLFQFCMKKVKGLWHLIRQASLYELS